MNWAAIIWLALMVLFLLIEGSTVAMVSLWFAVGSLAALVVSFFTPQWWIQFVVWLAVSLLLLAMLRPLARKHFTPKLTKTNVDSVIGTCGPVTEAIDNLESHGQVKLGAMEWSARSTSGEPIQAGTVVKVDRIEGVKVFVSPVEAEVKI